MRKYVPADAIEAEVWEAVRQLFDDKERMLRKMETHFEQRRNELSRPGPDAAALAAQRAVIERRWLKWQEAYEGGAILVADLKGHRAKLDYEHEALEQELERVRNREEELEKFAETEREMQERIEATENTLDDMTPEERRELYHDLTLRVEVGSDKRPHISGLFPVRVGDVRYTVWRTSDRHAYVIEHEPLPLAEQGYVSKKNSSLKTSRQISRTHVRPHRCVHCGFSPRSAENGSREAGHASLRGRLLE